LNPKDDARIYKEEIFGPVLSVKTFKTEEEVVRLANDTEYGLAGESAPFMRAMIVLTLRTACIYTNAISRALRVAGKLESGIVSINTVGGPTMSVPFGGKKQSGFGRESGKEGLLAYMESKTIIIK
jgi:aldehyde dehydrogenase (NAD+)